MNNSTPAVQKKRIHSNGRVLLVGGVDPTGGAGVSRDIQVCTHFSVKPFTVITALTAQNDQQVMAIEPVTPATLLSQLRAIENYDFDAVKVGMMVNSTLMTTFFDWFAYYRIHHPHTVLIVDPVLKSSNGAELSEQSAVHALQKVWSLIDVLTPNWPELMAISGQNIDSMKDVENVAQQLLTQGLAAIYVKGGHGNEEGSTICDYFTSIHPHVPPAVWLVNERLPFSHDKMRGTGCTVATATACMIAQPDNTDILDALTVARAHLQQSYQESITNHKQSNHDMTSPAPPVSLHLTLSGMPKHRENFPKLMTVPQDEGLLTRFPHALAHAQQRCLYGVVDNLDWLEILARQGVDWLQLRLKNHTPSAVRAQIRTAKQICDHYGKQLYVNDYWDMAIEEQAHGIHLGQEDLTTANVAEIAKSGCYLGISTHNYWEVCKALTIRPSYLAFGPIFATQTKAMRFDPQGLKRLQYWVEIFGKDVPICAIGGINAANFAQVTQTGVPIVAMVNGLRADRTGHIEGLAEFLKWQHSF